LETWVKLIEQNFIVLTLCEDLPVFKVGLGFGLDTKFELFVKKSIKKLNCMRICRVSRSDSIWTQDLN